MIDKNIQKEIMKEALEKYGVEPQFSQLQEECAELIVAVNKLRRKGLFKLDDNHIGDLIKYITYNPHDSTIDDPIIDFYSELADVEIMTQQLKLMIDNKLFEEVKSKKLERLQSRLRG